MQHKGDFGTVKTDTVDEIAEFFFMLGAQARVEHDFYPLAAFQFGSAFKIVLGQAAKLVLFADQALILLQQHRLGIHQQLAAIAVDNQRMAVQQRRLNIRPHHRRNAQRAHHNRGVGVRRAIAHHHAG